MSAPAPEQKSAGLEPVGMDHSIVANITPEQVAGKSPSQLTPEEKVYLITRNLQEVLGFEKLLEIVKQRDLKVYWGTATTGAPHVAYFVPMSKIADMLRAGCEVTILFADLHAFLDNMKSTWELLKFRTQYYEAIIKGMLKSIGVPLEKLKFVRGTDFQLSKEYTLDVYRMSSVVTSSLAKKAGADVVKQVSSPLLSGLLYPCLQALDEQYLGVDAQFGGVDQRKIFTFAEKFMPHLGYKKAVHLMNPMVPGLTGDKMSSSVKASKIDILDSPENIQDKIKQAFCPEKIVEGNGVLAFTKFVIFPLTHGDFVIDRPEKFGGKISFKNYAELEASFVSGALFPLDLKQGVTAAINRILAPVRTEFQTPERLELIKNAYPKDEEFKQAPTIALDDDDFDEDEPEEEVKKPAPKAGQPAAGGKKGAAAKVEIPADVSALDLRVGKVLSARVHEKSEHWYVCELDIGDGKNRQVVAGVAQHVAMNDMIGRLVVVFVNTKHTNLKGVRSEAMILGAQLEAKAELLDPPADSAVGDRVSFAGFKPLDPMPTHDPDKKFFPKVADHMEITAEGVAVFKHKGKSTPFTTPKGQVRVKSLFGARVK